MANIVSVALAGICGYGKNYISHLLTLAKQREIQLVGAIEPYPDRCPYLSELHAAAVPIFTSLEEFYNNSFAELLILATPIDLHHRQSCLALCKGSNVLCEKPLAATIEETEIMLSACEKANVLLGAAFMMRFHSQHQAALKMIQEGKIGASVFARAQLSCWYPPIEGAWRQDPKQGGGGSLMDMGGHCIDLLEMFFGKVKKVSCFINNTIHNYKSEDSAVVTLFFENGAIGTVDTFFCIPDNSSKNVLELYGSKGSILAKGTIGQGEAGEMTAFFENSDAGYNAQQLRQQGDGIKITPPPVNMYKAEIVEFSQAIIENRLPINNAKIGIQSQKVLTACYKSAAIGKVINID
jgi:predicted dehydrogenase